jgi:hypothetical protein
MASVNETLPASGTANATTYKHAIEQHVHIWSRCDDRSLGRALLLRQDEIGNSTLGVVVAPVIVLIPIAILHSVIGRGIDIVLDTFMTSNLICSDSIERLVLLSDGESVSVDPSSPNTLEQSVQVGLVVLLALYNAHVG